jgi:hypothetical protein
LRLLSGGSDLKNVGAPHLASEMWVRGSHVPRSRPFGFAQGRLWAPGRGYQNKKQILRLPLPLHSVQEQGPLRMTTYDGPAQVFENLVTSVIGWKLRWMLFDAGFFTAK